MTCGNYGDHVHLDDSSGEPLYLQLAGLLRAQIQDGKLTGRVPSARTLAEEYEVSHRTTESALAVLRDEGLIRSVRGKGHYTVRR